MNLQRNMILPHAQLVVGLPLNQLTTCWWMKLLTNEDRQILTVFSFEDAPMNRIVAFSIQGSSFVGFTFNATHK